MANHVTGYLSILQVSEEGQKVWDKIVSDLEGNRREGDYEVHLGFFIADSVTDDGDILMANGEQLTMNDMIEEIGAKWAYMSDADEYGMSMYSAWSPCLDFVDKVATMIGKVDPDVQITLTYEDEMPNFVGVATFTAKGMNVDNVLDHDEIMAVMKIHEPRLQELWDEDEDDWTDEEEAYDLISDIQWDIINEWQSDNADWDIV